MRTTDAVFDNLRGAKVRDLNARRRGLRRTAHEGVVRLDIAVHDVVLVQICQSERRVKHRPQLEADGDAGVVAQVRLEVPERDKLRDDPELRGRDDASVELYDLRAGEHPRQGDLAHERVALAVGEHVEVLDHLDGDVLLVQERAAVDHAGRTLADGGLEQLHGGLVHQRGEQVALHRRRVLAADRFLQLREPDVLGVLAAKEQAPSGEDGLGERLVLVVHRQADDVLAVRVRAVVARDEARDLPRVAEALAASGQDLAADHDLIEEVRDALGARRVARLEDHVVLGDEAQRFLEQRRGEVLHRRYQVVDAPVGVLLPLDVLDRDDLLVHAGVELPELVVVLAGGHEAPHDVEELGVLEDPPARQRQDVVDRVPEAADLGAACQQRPKVGHALAELGNQLDDVVLAPAEAVVRPDVLGEVRERAHQHVDRHRLGRQIEEFGEAGVVVADVSEEEQVGEEGDVPCLDLGALHQLRGELLELREEHAHERREHRGVLLLGADEFGHDAVERVVRHLADVHLVAPQRRGRSRWRCVRLLCALHGWQRCAALFLRSEHPVELRRGLVAHPAARECESSGGSIGRT